MGIYFFTQTNLDRSHFSSVLQSLSPAHPTHRSLRPMRRQLGCVGAEHSLPPLTGSQGLSSQTPLVEQTGNASGQSPSRLHSVHLLRLCEQMGREPGQSLSLTQRQTPETQRGALGSLQSSRSLQSTHSPCEQYFPLVQSLSALQAASHRFVVRLHVGFGALQSEFFKHSTQVTVSSAFLTQTGFSGLS